MCQLFYYCLWEWEKKPFYLFIFFEETILKYFNSEEILIPFL